MPLKVIPIYQDGSYTMNACLYFTLFHAFVNKIVKIYEKKGRFTVLSYTSSVGL